MGLVGQGVIGPGQAEMFDVVLRGGVRYGIFVHPFEPGVDFDLHVYDENGNLIEQDITTASDAYCFVTPRWTGPFRLKVDSARGASGFRIVVQD
jgi:hypothetical protein